MIFYGFLHSKEHLKMARNECSALFKAKNWAFYDHLTICEVNENNNINKFFSRLAFTKKIYLIHGVTEKIEEISDFIKPPKKTIRLDYESLDKNKKFSSKEIRKKVLSSWDKPKINLQKPDISLIIFSYKREYFLAELKFQNNEDFESRKNHNLPAPHPTSSHPKLLRAMINLSGAKKEILDPFCGSGGFLIEANLMNLNATGIDWDEDMISRAKENLNYLNLKAKLIFGNALDWNKKTENIVTDLPYGLNSKSEELNNLYKQFLQKISLLANKSVVCFPSLVNSRKLIKESGLKIINYYEWRIHKSLTKNIYVLE